MQGKPVRLEYDHDMRDKYQRLLAYVHLMDKRVVNEEIISNGYGHAYTTYQFRYMDKYRQHERQARGNKRGLWADGVPVATPQTPEQLIEGMVYITKSGTAYHLASCKLPVQEPLHRCSKAPHKV